MIKRAKLKAKLKNVKQKSGLNRSNLLSNHLFFRLQTTT
ncbi:hypothetical protein HPHPP4C_0756 [Helicobacter pylori Hp P-4c]|nr:hypothetical protein HPHPP4C_0756 [Helicobacter pylori Hp P-4c]